MSKVKLSRDEVFKVANLARLTLATNKVNLFQEQLSEVIDFNAGKLSQIKKKVTVDRKSSPDLGQTDDPRPSLDSTDALANAPEAERDFFVVPKVLDD